MPDTLAVMARPRKAPTDVVRMPLELVRKLRQLSARAGMTLPDYAAQIFGPIVAKKWDEMLDELAKEKKKK